MEIRDIMYLVLWAGLGLYCFFYAKKISPILYILGGFFTFMFGWYFVNDLITVDLFAGVYSIVFRSICAAFLVLVVILYIMIKRKPKE